MSNDDLIPADELLFDGCGTREEFIHAGPGFLWNLLVARAGLRAEHDVLDIGSGNGKHARVLVEFLTSGSYRGFDIVAEGISWCQERYARFANFEFTHADVYSDWYNTNSKVQAEEYKFPYAEGSFDVAFAASLFTHLEPAAAQNYFNEAYRVLRPGGVLLFTCFLFNNSSRLRSHSVQSQRFDRVSPTHWLLDKSSPSRGVGYEEDAVRWMVESAGLRVCEINYGTWSNGVDVLSAFQDCMIAIKPRG